MVDDSVLIVDGDSFFEADDAEVFFTKEQRQEFRECFDLFDEDGSGRISLEEFQRVTHELIQHHEENGGPRWSNNHHASFVEAFSKAAGDDQEIDFEEWLALLAHNHDNIFYKYALEADSRNLETMLLLLKGMPMPSSFGFPGSDGTLNSNWWHFVLNNHPLISAFTAHEMHPFTRFERLFVYICSVIFSWILNSYIAAGFNQIWGVNEVTCTSCFALYYWMLIKNTLVIVYAVLIRQIVICPCLAMPMLLARVALYQDDHKASQTSAVLAQKYDLVKKRGEILLMFLAVGHAALFSYGLYMATQADSQKNMDIIVNTLVQEAYGAAHWFLRFTPVFLILHPIHRYQWYHPGATWQRAVRATVHACFLRGCGCVSCACYCGGNDTKVKRQHRFMDGLHGVRPVMQIQPAEDNGGEHAAHVWRHHGLGQGLKEELVHAKSHLYRRLHSQAVHTYKAEQAAKKEARASVRAEKATKRANAASCGDSLDRPLNLLTHGTEGV